MPVDPYADCPCGSGKKFKFCCPDQVADLDKVQRMLEGEQPRAALSHLQKATAKGGDPVCLLDAKATIEMSLGDLEAAEATVDRFLNADPTHPTAHAQAALVSASKVAGAAADADAEFTARVAVNQLQDALERLDEAIPPRVLQAIGSVGQALLVSGNLVAARAHLWLYQGISSGAGANDNRATELLVRLNQMSGLPLLLRDNLFLRELPAGHPADAGNDEAQLLASRGQWRRSAEALAALCGEHPDAAVLHYNQAIVRGWLGQVDEFVAGLRRFAELVGDGDDAVEAEAIAQLLDPAQREPRIDVVRTTYEVANEESLVDRLTREARASAYQLSREELEAIDGPAPRQTLLLLDRPLASAHTDDLTSDDIPRIVGFLSYYGRQTDRAERLELVADRDDAFDATRALLAEVAGDAIGDAAGEEVVGKSSEGDASLRIRWRFPDDSPVAFRRRLLAEERTRAILADWPEAPKAALGGRSPREASADPEAKRALQAMTLVLSQGAGDSVDEGTFAKLRASLGLPEPAAIKPSEADLEMLPLSRLGRVDLSAASDEDLAILYERVEMSGDASAVVHVARAAVARPAGESPLPREGLFQRLATLEPDPADALKWVQQARDEAEAAGQSSALWDLVELELAVLENNLDRANELVQHVRDEHLNEPGVAERLYQVLYALGAIPENPAAAAAIDPNAMPGPAAAGDPGAPASSGLWTPDSEAAAPSPAGGGSKLWTPS